MTSSSSSSSLPSHTSVHDKKTAAGMHNTSAGESKPKQVVDGLVNKVKGVFNKEKTDEHNYQSGGASHVPPGAAGNEALRTDPYAHQQKPGVTGGAADIAGAAAGGYSGAADRHHHHQEHQPGQQQHVMNDLDQRGIHGGNDVTAHYGNDRRGGIAANAAGTAGAKLGAVEGAAKNVAEKATGRSRETHERGDMDTVANPYQNQQHVQNQPLGASVEGQHHRPSDTAKLDPLGNTNYAEQEQQRRQNVGNMAMENRVNDRPL